MSLGNRFGTASRGELVGVHSDLVIVTTGALIICSDQGVDFTVFDGIRTLREQQGHVDAGSSWTLLSRHRKQKSGFGEAVDLVPVINGKVNFDAINQLKIIGRAMKQVARHHDIPIVWGALKKYGGDWTRRNDMYHFELDRRFY